MQSWIGRKIYPFTSKMNLFLIVRYCFSICHGVSSFLQIMWSPASLSMRSFTFFSVFQCPQFSSSCLTFLMLTDYKFWSYVYMYVVILTSAKEDDAWKANKSKSVLFKIIERIMNQRIHYIYIWATTSFEYRIWVLGGA